ncbi:hypothetical protein B7494_g8093 [Chlorociboria aeruginascens]|nr:hypothetical protein B7494_g8093 [Chlorociboria aeruginascens]
MAAISDTAQLAGLGYVAKLPRKLSIEEIPNPSAEEPRILIFYVALSIVTGVGFLAALLLVSGGPEEIGDVIQSSLVYYLRYYISRQEASC